MEVLTRNYAIILERDKMKLITENYQRIRKEIPDNVTIVG